MLLVAVALCVFCLCPGACRSGRAFVYRITGGASEMCAPLLNSHRKNDAFRPPAVHELLDGLPGLVGRAGRGPVFRIPTGGPEMLFRY